MKKKIDEEIAKLQEVLNSKGWKKNSNQYYRYDNNEGKFILSIAIRREKGEDGVVKICAILRLYSIELNSISNFVWDFYKPEPDHAGLFRPVKLSIGEHLSGWYTCYLPELNCLAWFNGNDIDEFAEECIKLCFCLYKKYGSIDKLISFYESGDHFSGPLILMYLYKKEYRKIIDILKSEKEFPPIGGGNVKLGVWNYLEKNNLL